MVGEEQCSSAASASADSSRGRGGGANGAGGHPRGGVPEILVAYKDSQGYPEYLVTFDYLEERARREAEERRRSGEGAASAPGRFSASTTSSSSPTATSVGRCAAERSGLRAVSVAGAHDGMDLVDA